MRYFSFTILFLMLSSCSSKIYTPSESNPIIQKIAWLFEDPIENNDTIGFIFREDGHLILLNSFAYRGFRWEHRKDILDLTLGGTANNEGEKLSYKIVNFTGKKLTLEAISNSSHWQKQKTLTLVRHDLKSDTEIHNIYWILDDFFQHDLIPKQTKNEGEVFMQFTISPKGVSSMQGSSGINDIYSTYKLNSTSSTNISLGSLGSTRRMGPSNKFEKILSKSMKKIDYFVLYNDMLFLYSGTKPIASFNAQDTI